MSNVVVGASHWCGCPLMVEAATEVMLAVDSDIPDMCLRAICASASPDGELIPPVCSSESGNGWEQM